MPTERHIRSALEAFELMSVLNIVLVIHAFGLVLWLGDGAAGGAGQGASGATREGELQDALVWQFVSSVALLVALNEWKVPLPSPRHGLRPPVFLLCLQPNHTTLPIDWLVVARGRWRVVLRVADTQAAGPAEELRGGRPCTVRRLPAALRDDILRLATHRGRRRDPAAGVGGAATAGLFPALPCGTKALRARFRLGGCLSREAESVGGMPRSLHIAWSL